MTVHRAAAPVVMFDVGDTLVSGGRVIDGVPQALRAIEAQGVRSCLVSDYTMPATPDPHDVEVLFAEYCALIRGFGLEPFFAPLDRRATISTQAGVLKPDRRVFELALARLGEPRAALADALLVTENDDHVRAARALGMRALLYRPAGAPNSDARCFADWTQAPAKVAAMLAHDAE